MGHGLKETLIYSLADALGMNLDVGEMINGSASRIVKVGPLAMMMKCEVVSSQLSAEHGYFVILRMRGNLALFMSAKSSRDFDQMTLHLLNVAKMDSPTNWLEERPVLTVDEASAQLKPAIVKSFVKVAKNRWAESTVS